MQIGLVIYGSLSGQSGGYIYDQTLVESLERLGHSVRIISQKQGSYARQLSQSLSASQVTGLDLVIEDELNHPSCVSSNQRMKIPVISLVHHLRSSERHLPALMPLYRRVERRYLRTVDGFIFNSRTTEHAVRELSGSEVPGIVAYPSGDRCGSLPVTAIEQRLTERERTGLSLRLLFVGNLIPRKNLETLLRAVSRSEAASVLDVVGDEGTDPAYARRVRSLSSRLGLNERVRFHGRLNDQALSTAFSEADALVVPSEYEGFGMVYLEAFAHGLPAIGSRTGAAGEIITPGENGHLVDPQGVTELAEKLDLLARSDHLRQLSVNARSSFAKWPAWDQTGGAVEQFLRSFT